MTRICVGCVRNCPGICVELSWNSYGLQLLGNYWDLSGTVLEISGGVDNKTELIKRKHLDLKGTPNQAL